MKAWFGRRGNFILQPSSFSLFLFRQQRANLEEVFMNVTTGGVQ